MVEDNRQLASGRTAMSLDRMATILDAYGAHSDRWPESEKAAALALLAGSEEARRLRDEAADLDIALGDLQPPAPSGALRQRLMDVVPAAESGAPPAPFWRWIWGEPDLRPAAFATALLLAFIVGLLMPSPFREIAGEEAGRPAVADGPVPDVAALPLVDENGEQTDAAETILAAIPLQ